MELRLDALPSRYPRMVTQVCSAGCLPGTLPRRELWDRGLRGPPRHVNNTISGSAFRGLVFIHSTFSQQLSPVGTSLTPF